MSTVTNTLTSWANQQVVKAVDLISDETSITSELYALVTALIGGAYSVATGFVLQAGTGMTVNVGTGWVYYQGKRGVFDGGVSLTIAGNTSGFGRYDLIVATFAAQSGNNPAGLPNSGIVTSVSVIQGSPSAAPQKPQTTTGQIQVGSVFVPNGASSSLSFTINSGDTVPNSTPAFWGIVPSAVQHILASFANGPVHGFQATTPGGRQPGMLAVTDPVFGGVGMGNSVAANAQLYAGSGLNANTTGDGYFTVVSNGPSHNDGIFLEYFPSNNSNNVAKNVSITGPSGAALDLLRLVSASVNVTGSMTVSGGLSVNGATVATLDSNGRVPQAQNAQTANSATTANVAQLVQDTGGINRPLLQQGQFNAGGIPQCDSNGRIVWASNADRVNSNGGPSYVDNGYIIPANYSGNTVNTIVIGFHKTFAAGPQVVAQATTPLYAPSPGENLYANVRDITQTGFVLDIINNSPNAKTIAVTWIAVGM